MCVCCTSVRCCLCHQKADLSFDEDISCFLPFCVSVSDCSPTAPHPLLPPLFLPATQRGYTVSVSAFLFPFLEPSLPLTSMRRSRRIFQRQGKKKKIRGEEAGDLQDVTRKRISAAFCEIRWNMKQAVFVCERAICGLRRRRKEQEEGRRKEEEREMPSEYSSCGRRECGGQRQ